MIRNALITVTLAFSSAVVANLAFDAYDYCRTMHVPTAAELDAWSD
ncbi:MAG: hypothetical protein KDK03_05030 [Rhodobacteraceae bacterium]|nr:hypothetical protein [Paracoccaceae bacterium]